MRSDITELSTVAASAGKATEISTRATDAQTGLTDAMSKLTDLCG